MYIEYMRRINTIKMATIAILAVIICAFIIY